MSTSCESDPPTIGDVVLGPCHDLRGTNTKHLTRGSDKGQLRIGRLLSSLDAPGHPPISKQVLSGLGVADCRQPNNLANIANMDKRSTETSVVSQMTGATTGSGHIYLPPPGIRSTTLAPGVIRCGPGDASSAQTYNFTGVEKKEGSITTKSSRRRKRKHDWRPANCLPSSHGRCPSVPASIKTAPSQWSGLELSSGCAMNRWTASFDADRARFQSISVMCEQRLRKVSRLGVFPLSKRTAKACVMTEHGPLPDEFRAMAACEALGTMLPIFERYESLVMLVMKELLRSVYEDPDLVMNELLAWLHPDSSGQFVRAPAETMLLKSKPYFVRCRELKIQILYLQAAIAQKEEHEGTLQNNLTSARNSMRALLGKDSLLITRFIFAGWKNVVEDGKIVRRRFQRARLRIWFGGLRNRMAKMMRQEAKYQLGLRERELQVQTETVKEEEGGRRASRAPAPLMGQETTEVARAATTRELIAASMIEQAKFFMAEVQAHGNDSSRGNGLIMASVTKMAAAAKLAEERIRLDIGGDVSSVEGDEGGRIGRATTGTQTESAHSSENYSSGRTTGRGPDASPSGSNADPANQMLRNQGANNVDSGAERHAFSGQELRRTSAQADRGSFAGSGPGGGTGLDEIIDGSATRFSKLSHFALQAMTIPEMYCKKVIADASDDLSGRKRSEPAQAIESLVLDSCKGHTGHARLKMVAMKAAVRKYGSSGDGRVGVFGTLVGWVHEQSYIPQAMDLYLAVMMGIFSDQSHQLHARMVRGEGLAYVPLETVTRMINKLLPITDKDEHFNHRSPVLTCTGDTPNQMWAISEARKMDLTRALLSISRLAGEVYVGSSTYSDSYKVDIMLQVLDLDIAMEKIMRSWFEQRHENRRMLAKTIETHRGFGSGEYMDYARFSDMLWALSGNAMSTPVVLGLFKQTAVPDKQNRKMFSFKIASTLAEHILRVLSTLTPDKDRARDILIDGDDRYLKEKAQEDWQVICTKTTRKTHGQRLKLYVTLQACMRGWQTRWRHEMATRIQRLARGRISRRRRRR